jgi:hypothetical protein
MPTPYSGDRTATQTPASPPNAGAVPIASLPIAGEGATAASVAQMVKVLADYIAFEQHPFGNSTSWGQKIRAFQDALATHDRFAIDHWGLPRGEFFQWKEDWTPATPFGLVGPVSGTTTSQAGKWDVTLKGGGDTILSLPPGQPLGIPPFPTALTGAISPNAYRQAAIILDGAATGNLAQFRLQSDYARSVFDTDTLIVLEAEVQIDTVLGVEWRIGFCNTGESINSITEGVYFQRPDAGGTNWKCRTVSGASSTVDSGVSASPGEHHFEIDLVGSDVSDDGVSRALFFIDGVLVANLAGTLPTNLPLSSIRTPLPFFGGFIDSGIAVANQVMRVGKLSYTSIAKKATP